jgi:hypothetical protein
MQRSRCAIRRNARVSPPIVTCKIFRGRWTSASISPARLENCGPQGLSPFSFGSFTARLKSCPDTKPSSAQALNSILFRKVRTPRAKTGHVPSNYGTAEAVPFLKTSSHADSEGHCAVPPGPLTTRHSRAGLQVVSSPFDKLRAGSTGLRCGAHSELCLLQERGCRARLQVWGWDSVFR